MMHMRRGSGWIAAAVFLGAVGTAVAAVSPATAAPGCGTPAAITVNGDGRQLNTYSVDGTLLTSVTTADVLGDVAYGADGTLYGASFTATPNLETLDPATGAVTNSQPITGLDGIPNALSSLPDGTLVAAATGSAVLSVIDPATGVTTPYPRSLPTGYTSAGDFFLLGDGDLLALAVSSAPGTSADYLVRLHADGTSTVIGSVPLSYGAAFSGGSVYVAGADGTLRRVDALSDTASTDPLPTTDILTAEFSLYGAASAQDAAACPSPVLTTGDPAATAGTELPVNVSGFPADTDVTVAITDADGNPVGTTVVHTDATGTAQGTITVAAGATPGPATVNAATDDGAAASSPITIVAAPGTPVITGPTDGSTTNQPTPPISGTGTAGDAITVTDTDGNTVCAATVDADGAWSCQPTSALSDGAHTLTATASNSLGDTASSTPIALTVDTTAPGAPTVTTTTLDSSTGPISGSAEPNSAVTVRDADGATLCTTTASSSGAWTCTISTPLPEGPTPITATATDAAGNASAATDATVTVPIATAPAAPTFTKPATNALTNDATPAIAGTSDPGTTVTVVDDKNLTVCTATVTASGTWSCTPTTPLSDGSITLVATATDSDGLTSSPARTTFTVDTTAPAPPTVTPEPPLQSGAGPISGTAEPGTTITVTADGHLVCSTTTGNDGAWTCTLTPALPTGSTTLAATATDAVGNASTATTMVVTVRGTAIVTPSPRPTSPADETTPAGPRTAGTSSNPATLAYTGADGGQLRAMALAAMTLLSTGWVVLRRRRAARR